MVRNFLWQRLLTDCLLRDLQDELRQCESTYIYPSCQIVLRVV